VLVCPAPSVRRAVKASIGKYCAAYSRRVQDSTVTARCIFFTGPESRKSISNISSFTNATKSFRERPQCLPILWQWRGATPRLPRNRKGLPGIPGGISLTTTNVHSSSIFAMLVHGFVGAITALDVHCRAGGFRAGVTMDERI